MSNTAKWIIAVVVIILIIAGVYYYGAKPTVPAETGPIKIGVATVLTGDIAIWGQSGLAGVQLATNEINDRGGIKGRKIELVIEDSKGLAEGGVSAVNKLVNVDKVSALLIIDGSGVATAVAPIAQSNKIPMIATIASAPPVTKAGNYIFRSTPDDTAQGKFAADFMFDQLGKKKIAVLYVTNAWGAGIEGVFKKEFLTRGGQIAYESGVAEKDADLKGEIIKVKNSKAEALYFPLYPDSAIVGLKQAKELKLNIPVVEGDAIDGNDILKNPVAEGLIYTLAKIGSSDEFVAKLNSLAGFENLKPNIAAPTSYDGAKILFTAIEKAGTVEGSKVAGELLKTSYQGVSNPLIEFTDGREIKDPVFNVKQIKNGQVVDYK
ncbi:MAG: ABC transporter substrate-binding protein [Candidatus Paceibacterota bacterium]|jgi:branched-chain amino acid transport system substrate-binding protein